jgi:general secretion pathway protein B
VPVAVAPRAEPARPEPPPPAAELRPSPAIDRRVPARVVPPPAERSTASRLAPPAAAERSKIGSLTPPTAPVERSAAPPEVARAVPPRPSALEPAAPAGNIKAMTAKISLQVLSWAPEPKDRFVFLNGRRYGEGQKVDDQLLVEHIMEDGVVLSFQGERVTIKGR